MQQVGEYHDVKIMGEAKLSGRLQTHGDKVDQVKDGESGQQLVEGVAHVLAQQQEDGNGVTDDTKDADDAHDEAFEDETEKMQEHQTLLIRL